MKFDKEKIVLILLKASSYVINTIIVVGVLVAVGTFIYYLFMGSTTRPKTKAYPTTGYVQELTINRTV